MVYTTFKGIKFKVTASKKLKCNICGKNLYGKNGFVDIALKGSNEDFYTNIHKRICIDCFNKIMKQVEQDRENKEEKFNKLLRRNILRNLNDKNEKGK